MLTGTGETSDETSSSCFPPKASILGHNQDISATAAGLSFHSTSELKSHRPQQAEVSCSQMWEGGCSDRNDNDMIVARRHPLSTTTTTTAAVTAPCATTTAPPVFANSNDEVFCCSHSTGSQDENRSGSSSGSANGSGGRSLDPFTSSQTSFASDHHHHHSNYFGGAGQATEDHSRGAPDKATTTTTTTTPTITTTTTTTTTTKSGEQATVTPSSMVQCTVLDQHVPQLMELLSEPEGDSESNYYHHVDPTLAQALPTSISSIKALGSDREINNTITNTTIQRMKGSQSKMRSLPSHQPQFTLSSSAAPFEPTLTATVNTTSGFQKHHQQQQGIQSPPSDASCFSVTSFTEGEGPTSSADTKTLLKAGCEFVAAPLSVRKADPTLARLSPGEDMSVKEIFVGQLPFDFSPAALCDALRRLVSSHESVVTRFKMGPKPTCAFLTVKESFEAPLLNLTKKVLCDNNGMWVAYTEAAVHGLHGVSKRRVTLKKPGVPQRPMVIEAVNQVSHAPKVHHHRAPPTYLGQQQENLSSGGSQQQFYAQRTGNNVLQQTSAGRHQQQRFYNHFGSQQGHRHDHHQNGGGDYGSKSGMSVCLCGTRHVVAMTRSLGQCTMCTRDLPNGVMVRRCPQCPGTDICTVCVAMANGSADGQPSRPVQPQPRFTEPSASSHHQFSQRYLMDEEYVIY